MRTLLGRPAFERELIPMFGTGSALCQSLRAAGRTVDIAALRINLPYVLAFCDEATFAVTADALSHHEYFGETVTPVRVEVLSENELALTLSCETSAKLAAAAAVCACCLRGLTGSRATVHVAGETIEIEYLEDGNIYRL